MRRTVAPGYFDGTLFASLDPQERRDLPERTKSFWKMAGPGAILVGLSIGAGEIVIWPRIVAEHGASMVWAAVLGVFLQMFVNLEIARWTIATGETVYTGMARVWRGFGPVFILLTFLAWLAPGWARASGLALKALLVGPDGFGTDTFWTVVTFAAAAAILFGPKVAYLAVERTVEALVVIVTIGLVLVAIAVGTADAWRELGAGIVNVGYRAPGMTVKALFVAIVFAGAGGTANLFYSFYLRDKGIGMGAHVPTLQNPLRGRPEAIASTGFTFEGDEENVRRFRSWWAYIKQDQALFFWGLNTVTILLFIFGALAVLYPQGVVPAAGSLIWDEAAILEGVWGPAGRTLFLLVGLATLFSTQLAVLDGVARSLADIVHTNFAAARARSVNWWYLVVASVWIVAGCAITWVMESAGVTELGFLFNAAYMGGFAMAIYVPVNLYMNYRFLPAAARPGLVCTGMAGLAGTIYVGFALASLWWEIMGGGSR